MKLFILLMEYSLKEQVVYKFNFIMGVISDVIYLGISLVYYFLFYVSDVKIRGLSSNELLLFVGTNYLIVSVYVTIFYRNIHLELPANIVSGNFDLLLINPISIQYLSSFRHGEFATNLAGIIGGVIIIIVSWTKLKIPFTIFNLFMYLVLICIGIMTMYAFFLILHTLCFYLITIQNFSNFIWEIMVINKIPMFIYNKTIQFFGIFIFPIFLFSNLPYIFLCQLRSYKFVTVCVITSFVFFILSRLCLKKAVNRYSSASS